MRHRIFVALVLSVLLALAVLSGCTKAVEEKSENGLFSMEMTVEDGNMKTGKNIVHLRLTDQKGAPVPGASIAITPWMPGMDHGTPYESMVTDLGEGRYRTNIPLTMGGHWEITMDITKDGETDTVVFNFLEVEE
jgi:hypothetical protein